MSHPWSRAQLVFEKHRKQAADWVFLLFFKSGVERDLAQIDLFLLSVFINSGWPLFGCVRLRFAQKTVRKVPVFGSHGSSGEGFSLCFYTDCLTERQGCGSGLTALTVLVLLSVPKETVPMVPVSGFGSVPVPPCQL